MERCGWGRRTLIEQSIWNSRYSFEHRSVVEGIFSYFVKGIKNAQRWKHTEDLSPVAWQFDYLIIKEIQLKKRSHLFEGS